MRPVGFSTGALAPSDPSLALELLGQTDADAVELSALRLSELDPLLAVLRSTDLSRYRHISLHAPSRFSAADEMEVIARLCEVSTFNVYVVAHPDAMHDVGAWAALGPWLCIENMDKRKPTGRTAVELAHFFAKLPEAGLCFDVAHARQVDGSMTEAYLILKQFAGRLRQLHISEVGTSSRHSKISEGTAVDVRGILPMIPPEAPAISEAPVTADDIGEELAASRAVLTSDSARQR